jgi:hypothetical protein
MSVGESVDQDHVEHPESDDEETRQVAGQIPPGQGEWAERIAVPVLPQLDDEEARKDSVAAEETGQGQPTDATSAEEAPTEVSGDAAQAPEEPEPDAEPEPDGQQTLEIGPVEASHGPEAEAAVAAASAETHVATYGEPGLDEMVAALKQNTPGVGPDGAVVEPGAGAGGSHLAVEERAHTRTWPFLVYAGIWLVFALAFSWFLRVPAGHGDILDSKLYPYFLYGGLALGTIGLLLVPTLWMWERSGRQPGVRAGLFTSVFLKSAFVLFAGMVLWWAASFAAMALSKV